MVGATQGLSASRIAIRLIHIPLFDALVWAPSWVPNTESRENADDHLPAQLSPRACTRQMGQADRILDGLSLADDDAKSKLGCDFFLTRQNGKPAVRALDTRIVCRTG